MDHTICLFDLVTKPDGPSPMREMTDTAHRLSDQLIEYEGTVRQAFRNFRGVLLFHLERPEKALECFQQVIKDDPNNINGLKNLIYALKKIRAASDVKTYETKLQCLLDSDDKNEAQLSVARFYAELGLALSYDFNFGTETSDQRFQRGIKFFEKALKNSHYFKDSTEWSQWHFFAARLYHRLYDERLKRQPNTEIEEQTRVLEHCSSLLLCVLNNKCTSAEYMSQAWCLLGTVFFKTPENHRVQFGSFIENNGLEREFKNPSLCFGKARDLCPNNAKLMCRYARMFITRRFWNYHQALSLLNHSIALDNTELNWLAFSTRAKAHKRQYMKTEKDSTTSQQQQLLELAKEDLEKLLKLKQLPFERMELAEICHLLAKTQSDQGKSKCLFRESMCHFQQAEDGSEGGKPKHVLYFKWGRCLRDCEEVRGAIECFKTSLECDDTMNYPYIVHFSELMALMLSECRKGKVSVKETAFWLDFSIRKYSDHTGFYIEKLCETFPAAEMFDVCMELVKTSKFEAASFILPKMIKGLRTILHLAGRNKCINIPVVKNDLKAAQNSLQSIKDQMVRKETSPSKLEAQLEKARNTKSKMFDFCVLYSDTEREWVCYSMIPKLEDWYKFRGFISDRDILFGRETTDELGHGIESSVCTVAVISPDFLENEFLHKMLLCAFHEDDHHILLLQYAECEVPSKVKKLSLHPVICFPGWHALNVKLEELTGVE